MQKEDRNLAPIAEMLLHETSDRLIPTEKRKDAVDEIQDHQLIGFQQGR